MSIGMTAEKVLYYIEKQAVLQVLIQQVAAFFDPRDSKKKQNVSFLFYNKGTTHKVFFLLTVHVSKLELFIHVVFEAR